METSSDKLTEAELEKTYPWIRIAIKGDINVEAAEQAIKSLTNEDCIKLVKAQAAMSGGNHDWLIEKLENGDDRYRTIVVDLIIDSWNNFWDDWEEYADEFGVLSVYYDPSDWKGETEGKTRFDGDPSGRMFALAHTGVLTAIGLDVAGTNLEDRVTDN